MEQHELKEGKLLDYEGNLNEAGYAFSLVKKYRRKDIVLKRSRIKEWDYYAILNNDFGLCFTISDLTILSLVSVSYIDLNKKKFKTVTKIKPFSNGKLNLPSTSETGDVSYKSKNFSLSFLNNGKTREIKCFIKNFIDKKDLDVDVIFSETSPNSMVIVTPFFKKGQFYYNQKINNLVANGYFKLANKLYPIKDNTGVLDWGRGVWPRNVLWYWATCSFKNEYGYIGFNLGYGFGDTSKASENMLFVNDVAYKLDDVTFYFKEGKKNKIDYLGNIKVISKSKDIDLIFTPIVDRHEDTNLLFSGSWQHQIFGKYTGTFKVKDKVYKIKDAPGFIERIKNKW